MKSLTLIPLLALSGCVYMPKARTLVEVNHTQNATNMTIHQAIQPQVVDKLEAAAMKLENIGSGNKAFSK